MPPKEKLKVKKNPLKKNHVILLHMVTQAAQQVGGAIYYVYSNNKQFSFKFCL
jgi:phage pi2 protein 07